MNVLLRQSFFWDGRAETLEQQALFPIENSKEMNMPIQEAICRLKESPMYRKYFQEVFNSGPTKKNLAEALAAFERTLETSESPFDKWQLSRDSTIISKEAIRGFNIFNNKGICVRCHFGSDFTTNEFRNIGLFNGKDLNDSGRSVISRDKKDVGKFKIPTLRNVSLTAPYMHNGMFRSLKEVIEFYDVPDKIIPHAINRDSLLSKPLNLSREEKKDLEAFLRSLTDLRFSTNKLDKRTASLLNN